MFNLLKNACDVLTYANSAKCSHLPAASFLRSPPLRPLLVPSSTSLCVCVRACKRASVQACKRVRACVRACKRVRACVRACARVCVRASACARVCAARYISFNDGTAGLVGSVGSAAALFTIWCK